MYLYSGAAWCCARHPGGEPFEEVVRDPSGPVGIGDELPHSVAVTKDGGTVVLYVDGKRLARMSRSLGIAGGVCLPNNGDPWEPRVVVG